MFVDSHAHIGCKELKKSVSEIIKTAEKSQLSGIVNVGCEREHLDDNCKFTATLKDQSIAIYCTVGVHPDHYKEAAHLDGYRQEINEIEQELRALYNAYKDSIVAIGETGLDYYWPHHKEAQKLSLEMHLKLGQEFGLPVVIHIRDAWEDFFAIMDKHPQTKGVVHCFTGELKHLHRVLTYPNLLISFTGIITFKNAQEQYVPVLQEMPLERMMIETDSPYLAPTPYRGKTNQPAYVVEVAKHVATIKNLPLEKIAQQTTENAVRFFGVRFL